jgi:hypothetical protein
MADDQYEQQQSASEQQQSASEQPLSTPPARDPDWIEPETIRGSEPPPMIRFPTREQHPEGDSEGGGDSQG